jgi:hypothetical protein
MVAGVTISGDATHIDGVVLVIAVDRERREHAHNPANRHPLSVRA